MQFCLGLPRFRLSCASGWPSQFPGVSSGWRAISLWFIPRPRGGPKRLWSEMVPCPLHFPSTAFVVLTPCPCVRDILSGEGYSQILSPSSELNLWESSYMTVEYSTDGTSLWDSAATKCHPRNRLLVALGCITVTVIGQRYPWSINSWSLFMVTWISLPCSFSFLALSIYRQRKPESLWAIYECVMLWLRDFMYAQ